MHDSGIAAKAAALEFEANIDQPYSGRSQEKMVQAGAIGMAFGRFAPLLAITTGVGFDLDGPIADKSASPRANVTSELASRELETDGSAEAAEGCPGESGLP